MIDQIDFYFPLQLDASAGVPAQKRGQSQKRASVSTQVDPLKKRLSARLKLAAQFFEKAIQLDPEHQSSYLSLAMVRLIENNPYLVRGVLQGRYIPRFGEDASVLMLLAIISSQQGDFRQAESLLKNALTLSKSNAKSEALPRDLLSYSVVYNLAALYQHRGQSEKAGELWRGLAQREKSAGNAVLFRTGVKKPHRDTAGRKSGAKQGTGH